MNLTKKYIIIKMPPKQTQASKKGAKASPPAKAAASKKGKKDVEESKEEPTQRDREEGTVESEGDEDDEIL
jgi:hypothetical protein